MRWYDPIEQRWHDPKPTSPRELTEEERVRSELSRIDEQIRRRQAVDIWRAVVSTANGTTAKPSEPPAKPKPPAKSKLCRKCHLLWLAGRSVCGICGRPL